MDSGHQSLLLTPPPPVLAKRRTGHLPSDMMIWEAAEDDTKTAIEEREVWKEALLDTFIALTAGRGGRGRGKWKRVDL